MAASDLDPEEGTSFANLALLLARGLIPDSLLLDFRALPGAVLTRSSVHVREVRYTWAVGHIRPIGRPWIHTHPDPPTTTSPNQNVDEFYSSPGGVKASNESVHVFI